MKIAAITSLGFCVLCATACSGGGGGGSSPTPHASSVPDVVRSYPFPAGDASAPAGVTAWDITNVTTTLSSQFGGAAGNAYDTLRVDVTFTQNVANALPPPGSTLTTPTQLGVQINLDTDGSVSSGGNFQACSSAAAPFDFYSDAALVRPRLADGNFAIIHDGVPIETGGSDSASEANASVSGTTFSETFFLSALGVSSGITAPTIGIGVVAYETNGTTFGSSDCVPKSSTEVLTT